MARAKHYTPWEQGKFKYECTTCGKEIWKYKSDVAGKKNLYCSRECFHSNRVIRVTEDTYKEFIERYYLKHVDKDPDYKGPNGDCWGWTGGTSEGRYGRIWSEFLHKNIKAHRFSWEYHNKASILNSFIVVCHKCDNPPCTNPDHLFLGTSTDNTNDMLRKNRLYGQLLSADVWLIRWGLNWSTADLALLFGAYEGTISKILHNHTRLDVKEDDFDFDSAIKKSSINKKNNSRRDICRDLSRYSFYKPTEPPKNVFYQEGDEFYSYPG